MSDFFKQKIKEAFAWAEASSFRYFVVKGACCADEFIQTQAARYDLERFGAIQESDHRAADVLVVLGAISQSAEQELKKIFDEMAGPRWCIAIGSCACSGGLFSKKLGGEALPGVGESIAVDVFVSGCPPRPEAIIDGLLLLQNKVRGIQNGPKRRSRRHELESLLSSDDWRGP